MLLLESQGATGGITQRHEVGQPHAQRVVQRHLAPAVDDRASLSIDHLPDASIVGQIEAAFRQATWWRLEGCRGAGEHLHRGGFIDVDWQGSQRPYQRGVEVAGGEHRIAPRVETVLQGDSGPGPSRGV